MNEIYIGNNKNHFAFRLLLIVLFLGAIYYLRDIMAPVIISTLLFYILNPVVEKLSNKRPHGFGIPLQISIAISFVLTGVAIYFFFRFVIPPLAKEFKHFAQNIPYYVDEASLLVNKGREWYLGQALPHEVQGIITQSIKNIVQTLISFAEEMMSTILGVFSRFIQMLIIPILTYYFLKDKNQIKHGLVSFLPDSGKGKAIKIISRVNDMLSSYVKAIFTLCFFIGTISTVGLYFLGVKYFIVLGLIAGVTEAIPFLGPWIGSVPAIIVAFLSSPYLAAQVAIFYLAVQAIENSLLVPKILGANLKVHPVAIIIGMLVLGKLMGLVGLFFTGPILATLMIIYEEIQS